MKEAAARDGNAQTADCLSVSLRKGAMLEIQQAARKDLWKWKYIYADCCSHKPFLCPD